MSGHKAKTFRESALLRGLLESDNNLEECLEEAASYQMPATLRRLFAIVLVYNSPRNPKKMWEIFESLMSEDYQKRNRSKRNNEIQVQVPQNINLKLQSMGKKVQDYEFVNNNITRFSEPSIVKEIEDEMSIMVIEKEIHKVTILTTEQRIAYDIIMKRIYYGNYGAFFIDGPGGTGKTYLYCALLASIRSNDHIALATATSGVAASILPGGRTAHSRFNISINVDSHTTCNIGKQTRLAEMIRATKLIIWDKASMTNKQLIETFDRMRQDINDCKLPFGGKVVVFGGDFRQVLSVVPRSTKEEAINAILTKSCIWPKLKSIKLTENMQAKFDMPFTDFLLRRSIETNRKIVNMTPIQAQTDVLLSDDKAYCIENLGSFNETSRHVFSISEDVTYENLVSQLREKEESTEDDINDKERNSTNEYFHQKLAQHLAPIPVALKAIDEMLLRNLRQNPCSVNHYMFVDTPIVNGHHRERGLLKAVSRTLFSGLYSMRTYCYLVQQIILIYKSARAN